MSTGAEVFCCPERGSHHWFNGDRTKPTVGTASITQ